MNWETEVSLCDGGIVSSDAIVSLLSDNLRLETAQAVLAERYRKMQLLYSNASADDPRWRQDGCTIADTRNHWDVLLGMPHNVFGADNPTWCGTGGILKCEDVGIDLPTWMMKRNANPQIRIMVVAEEPKRQGLGTGALWVSSPWAFHSVEYRNHSRNPRMRTIIEAFMQDKEGVVYMTDIRKIYAKGTTHRGFDGTYRSILDCEIELFNPSVLIGYGSTVLDELRPGLSGHPDGAFARLVCHRPYEDLYNGIRTLVFAHPSPLNASLGCVASNVMNENPGITREEAIVKYYTEW